MDTINEDELLEQIRAELIEQAAAEGLELTEEQLDELSKHTLHSYAAKAKGSAQAARAVSKIAKLGADDDRAAKFADKAKKRAAGAKKASSKLSESIEEMIAAAHEGKPVEFAAAFNGAMRSVIDDKIDALRPTVAAGLFGGEKE